MEKRAIFRKGLEIREADNKRVIRGYPILFDEVTDRVGYYKEKVDRNALNGADLSETVLLVGHNFDNLLAKNGVNMRMEVDETGLFFEADLGDTEYDKLIYDRVQRKILTGMSFGFSIDELTTDYEEKLDTIMRIGTLYEITLTPIPAYPQTVATAVERDAQHESELREADEIQKAKEQADIEEQAKIEKEKADAEWAKELENL